MVLRVRSTMLVQSIAYGKRLLNVIPYALPFALVCIYIIAHGVHLVNHSFGI